jgi:glycine/D-amino acid oxidase-like deaminating enzyme
MRRLAAQQAPEGYDCEIVERRRLDNVLPGLGPDVVGASFSPHDGRANPLRLLGALHRALGRSYRPASRVDAIRAQADGFVIETESGSHRALRLVLAAGLGNVRLAEMLGARLPIRPQRGQILVTERVAPFLEYPMSGIRQTEEGTVMLGVTNEEVGFETGTTIEAMRAIARNAVRVFPQLRAARLVRAWAALRILSPDGFPIYQTLPGHDRAFVATCHSGVTLAGAHALRLAGHLAAGALPPALAAFHSRRFDVPQAA